MANTSKKPAARAKRKVRTLAFPVEFRLRIVKLFLEEGYSARLLVEQFEISTSGRLKCYIDGANPGTSLIERLNFTADVIDN